MPALLIILTLLTGCATTRYQWTSETGRLCFYQCKRDFYACRQSCLGNGWCAIGCGSGEHDCARNCPDVQAVVQ